MLNSNLDRVEIDEAYALRMARAATRDPSILERKSELVRQCARFPQAREMLDSVFKGHKKVAHRFQHARTAVNTAAFA
jgi:hypothetical protein